MKKIASGILVLLFLILAGGACADGSDAPMGTAIINGGDADRVHLREEPSASAQSLGLLFSGTEVSYYSDPGDEWVQVALPGAQYGMLGYIKSEYLYTGDRRRSLRGPARLRL